MTSLDNTSVARTVIVIVIAVCFGLSSIMMFSTGIAGEGALSEDSRYGSSSGQAEIVVDYGTYIGGGDLDEIVDIAVGPDGSIYLVGRTTSDDFPTTESAVNRSNNGWNDVFVCKFSPDGRDLIYSTYFGGTDGEHPQGIAVDKMGCVYVVGTTSSSDFPTTPGCLQEACGNRSDAFVFKLSPDGDRVEFSTYLGGRQNDGATDILYDHENGICIVVGYTQSEDFPTTPGVYDSEVNGWDAFVAGLSTDGARLIYSSLLGDRAQDRAHSVALDPSGNIVVSGFSSDNYDFPVTVGAYQVNNAGGNDGFVAVLNDQASSLLRSTYLGGNGDEVCEEVVVLQNGDIAVIGRTDSNSFPTSADAYDASFGGGRNDAYLSILNDDLSDLVYSTYLGGQYNEYHGGLVTDGHGTVYVSGSSDSLSYPTTENAIQETTAGGEDFIIFVLDTSTNLPLLSTYCGGRTVDRSNCLALGNNATLIVPGFTTSYNFPVTGDAYEPNHDFHWDGAFVIIQDVVPPLADAGEDVIIDQHEKVEFNASGSNDNVRLTSWSWSFTNGSEPISLNGTVQSYIFHDAGRYVVTLNVTDTTGNWAVDRMNVTVRDTTAPSAVITCEEEVEQNVPIFLDGSGSNDNVAIMTWTWTIYDSDGQQQVNGSTAQCEFDIVGIYQVVLNVTDGAGNYAVAYRNITVIDTTPPTARAGRDITVDQYQMVILDGTGSTDNVGVVNWTWHVTTDDGSTTYFGQTLEITFDEPGIYPVVLVVKDAWDNEGLDMLTLTVRDITPPIAKAGDDVHIDQHETALFDGQVSSDNVGITDWIWDMVYDGNDHEHIGPSFEFTFDEPGEYLVTLLVADAAGNIDQDVINVTVVDITPPVTLCGPAVDVDQYETVPVDGGLCYDNVGIVNYTWTLFVIDGQDEIEYGLQTSFVIADVGTHKIRLVVMDAAGNVGTATLQVHVSDITPPEAIITLDKNVTTEGGTITFDGSESSDNVGIVRWTWTFMYKKERVTLDGDVSTFKFKKPGDYDITLTVEDAEGNTNATLTTHSVNAEKQTTSSFWGYLIIILIVVAVIAITVLVLMRSKS